MPALSTREPTIRPPRADPPPEPPRARPLALAVALVTLTALALLVAVLLPTVGGGPLDTVRRALPAAVCGLSRLTGPREELELPAIEAVNAARLARGVAPVRDELVLREVARARSLDMATNSYFSHTAPDGSDVFGMLDLRGYFWLNAGENLFLSTLEDQATIESAVEFWSRSPEHAANLFNSDFAEGGVGVAQGSQGIYLTLVLARR